MALLDTDLFLVQDASSKQNYKISFDKLTDKIASDIDLDTRYVQDAGDNMTGDLTLGAEGSPVITLNADTGNIEGSGITASDYLAVTGDITATGNVTANAFVGDGSQLTGISTFWNRSRHSSQVNYAVNPKTITDDVTIGGLTQGYKIKFRADDGVGEFKGSVNCPTVNISGASPRVTFEDTSGLGDVGGTYIYYSSSNGLGGDLRLYVNGSTPDISFIGNVGGAQKRLGIFNFEATLEDSFFGIGNLEGSNQNPNIKLMETGAATFAGPLEAESIDGGEYS